MAVKQDTIPPNLIWFNFEKKKHFNSLLHQVCFVFQRDLYLFSFLGSRCFSSSSNALSLFLMAATFSSRLICPELLPLADLVLFASGNNLLGRSWEESSRSLSLAKRTTKGLPQANLPCIFSLANSASCMLTLDCRNQEICSIKN